VVHAPSSAHRGSGRRKWLAKIVCVISCGSTESRIRSSLPWIVIVQLNTSPRSNTKLVAPPAPRCGATCAVIGQGRLQRGSGLPVHSMASVCRYCSAASPILRAWASVGASTMKFAVR